MSSGERKGAETRRPDRGRPDVPAMVEQIRRELPDERDGPAPAPAPDGVPAAEERPLALGELLGGDTESFVRRAYSLLLGREAEPEEIDYYRDLLRERRNDRVLALGLIRWSAEGKQKNVPVSGLRRRFAARRLQSRLRRLPILGRVFSFFMDLPGVSRRLDTLARQNTELQDALAEQAAAAREALVGERIRSSLELEIERARRGSGQESLTAAEDADAAELRTVLMVCNAYPPRAFGGAELIAHQQAKAMIGKGHRVVVLAAERSGDRCSGKVWREDFDGVEVWRIQRASEDFSAGALNFLCPDAEETFERLAERLRPDILHMHNMLGLSLPIADLAKKRGMKVFMTVHDAWLFCQRSCFVDDGGKLCADLTRCGDCLRSEEVRVSSALRRDYFRFMLDRVDAFISPSRWLAECCAAAGYPAGRLHVIPNGVDSESFRPLPSRPSDRLRLTFAGYFGRHKGVGVLLEAAARAEHKDRFRIRLVGAGEEEANYREFIRRHGLENTVEIAGKVPNPEMPAVYADTDVFVLPSLGAENQPVTVTEAMACCRAVVASDIGGIPELVRSGETGFLFEPGNAEELSVILDWCAEHPAELAAFGKAGRRRIEGLIFDRQAGQILALYERTRAAEREEFTIVALEDARIGRPAEEGNGETLYIPAAWLPKDVRPDVMILGQDTEMTLQQVRELLDSGTAVIAPEAREDIAALLRGTGRGLYYVRESSAPLYAQAFLKK